jgi:hypothetical protein
VSADLFLLSQQKRIVAAATQYNLPTMYPWREYVIAGGMVSYGPSLRGISPCGGLHRENSQRCPTS